MAKGFLIGETLLGQIKDTVKRVDGVPEGGHGLRIPTRLESMPVRWCSNVVSIKNNSGVDVPMCGVLGISGVEINPSGGNLTGNTDADKRAREFVSRPILTGVTPTTDHAESFVVTLEPIANDKIGRAAVSGAFACRVNVTNASHRFATAKNGDWTQLQSAACGVLQLVWKETGTGANKWSVGVM